MTLAYYRTSYNRYIRKSPITLPKRDRKSPSVPFEQ